MPETLGGPFQRRGQGDISGSVTLNGATTTDPSYQAAPFRVAQDGRADDIALFALQTATTPGSANSVRAAFSGTGGSLGFLNYTAGAATTYLPIYLPRTELITLTLYNAATEAGALFNEAVTWSGSFKTVGKEDLAEPNDDENPATFTDRATSPTVLSAGAAPTKRTVFQRTAGSNQDQEDWFRVTLTANTRYKLNFVNSNGTWGNWTYTLKLVNGAGNAVLTKANITGTSAIIEPQTNTTQTYHLQVTGVPTSRRGNSVYFGEYSVALEETPIPVITAVT
ncbi:MAG TPA: hypothetical protein VEI97_09180, partial [bacterium]|nr:hypothetical protein [bacterium]